MTRIRFVVFRGTGNRVSAGNQGLQQSVTLSRFTLRLHSVRTPVCSVLTSMPAFCLNQDDSLNAKVMVSTAEAAILTTSVSCGSVGRVAAYSVKQSLIPAKGSDLSQAITFSPRLVSSDKK